MAAPCIPCRSTTGSSAASSWPTSMPTSALLAAVEEELSEREAEWFRAQRGHQRLKSPFWITRFEKYEEVQGVLWPTRWRRTEDTARRFRPYSSTILLNVAFNGEEPSRQPPELE